MTRKSLADDIEIEYVPFEAGFCGRIYRMPQAGGKGDSVGLGVLLAAKPGSDALLAGDAQKWRILCYLDHEGFTDEKDAQATRRSLARGLAEAGLCEGEYSIVFYASWIHSLIEHGDFPVKETVMSSHDKAASRARSGERCSFCEKKRPMVECLIAGPPGIYICNECVELCESILVEEVKVKGGSAPDGQGGFALGIRVVPETLRVSSVTGGSAADKAGIAVDDVLDHDLLSLRKAIREGRMEGKLTVKRRRGDAVEEVEIPLEEPGKEWSL